MKTIQSQKSSTNGSVPDSWLQDLREHELHQAVLSAVNLQFLTAVSSIEHRAKATPAHALRHFRGCVKAVAQIYHIARVLRDCGHPVLPELPRMDEEWHAALARDLFLSLSPSTQALLIQQGLDLGDDA